MFFKFRSVTIECVLLTQEIEHEIMYYVINVFIFKGYKDFKEANRLQNNKN